MLGLRTAHRNRKSKRAEGTVHKLGPEDYNRMQEIQAKDFQEVAERQRARERGNIAFEEAAKR